MGFVFKYTLVFSPFQSRFLVQMCWRENRENKTTTAIVAETFKFL